MYLYFIEWNWGWGWMNSRVYGYCNLSELAEKMQDAFAQLPARATLVCAGYRLEG